MKTIIKALSCAIILTCSFNLPDLHAQHTVQGTVTNAETGQPLPNVNVYIYELNKGTVTDENGHFQLQNLPGGPFTITFSFIGFKKVNRTIDFKSDADTNLSISLERTILQGEELLITGSRVYAASALPLGTSVVTNEDIVNEGDPSLWETVQKKPGASIQTNGPGIERPVIRGLATDRIEIVNRGSEYHYQTWDPESGLSMNGNGIEQVEIIRGPESLQYGSGAMGGVISLAQDQPAPVGKTVGLYQGGVFSNTAGINNKIALKQAREGAFWGFSGSFDTHADYEPGSGESETEESEREAPNSRYNNLQLQANGGLTRSWGTTRLSYEYLQHKNGIIEMEEGIEGAEEEAEGRSIHRPYHNLENHSLVSVTNWYQGATNANLTLGLQSNQQQEFEGEGEGEEEAAMDLTLNAVNYNLNVNHALGSSVTLNAGIDGDVQHNESKGEETFVPNADILNAGLFAILQWKTAPEFTLRGGARFDYSKVKTSPPEEEGGNAEEERLFDIPEETDRNFNSASGSLGLIYHPAPQWEIKTNAAVGFRTPNIAELTADGLLREVRQYQVGDNDLSAEHNLEGDIGIAYTGANVSVDVNTFYNYINNFIYQQQQGEVEVETPDGPETYDVYYYRQAAARLWGGETGLTIHPQTMPWLQLASSFELVIGEFADQDGYLPLMSAPHWTNSLMLSRPAIGPFQNTRLELSLSQYFRQSRNAAFEEETPGYLLTDVSLGAELPLHSNQVHFSLAVHNLFDVRYTSHLSLLKREGIPNMGRNISFIARIPFNL